MGHSKAHPLPNYFVAEVMKDQGGLFSQGL